VLCFTSGAVRAHGGFEFQRNVLFDLVELETVDGVIISGTLAHPISAQEVQEFFQRYAHMPRVSIALAMPGIPYVMVDSMQAIRQVVTHLVETHGYRRLAFLRGPARQQEAEERFAAFSETLARYGLKVDPALVFQGDYTIASGEQALRTYLAAHRVDFDAIVCSNDSMALGAMNVLEAHGVQIPGQVALTGFDDVEARFARVPLTSVRQDIAAQGALAARTLLDLIAGREVPLRNIATAPMVVRRSCGCGGLAPLFAEESLAHDRPWDEMLQLRREAIQKAVCASVSHISAVRVMAWVSAWLDAIRADLQAGTVQRFLSALEQSQREGFELEMELSAWNRCLPTFFHQVRLCLNDPQDLALLGQIEEQSSLQLGMTMELLENMRQTEIEFRELALREMSESLITTFDRQGVFDVLSLELARLNVRALYISLFEDPQKPADFSRLIYAWRNGQPEPVPNEGIVFPSRQLLPAEINALADSTEMIVEALYSKEDRLGFMLIDVDRRHISITSALRALVSGALQSVLLLEERRKTELELLHSQAKLQATVEKLEAANHELESFAYSVSHDLRSPLRSIIGFASILEQDHRQELSVEAHAWLERIIQNARRMGVLIDDLLAFSRVGRQSFLVDEVDMEELVRAVIADLTQDGTGEQVSWVLGPLAPAPADLPLMRQVWINLIGNALKYSARAAKPQIEIGSRVEKKQVVYFVRDNGVGFDMRYADKIFGVFQRLHREEDFPGTGIGLAIVHRIILRHGGRIWAEATVGQGASFFFSLPVDHRDSS
jgi:signal transduction histidine kinase